ncbi:MAG: hypothetical protein JOY54_07030 [Acidobacteriaceae bacterium]|nr:hypothetical protein [Acidobacteriaceae bacterium]
MDKPRHPNVIRTWTVRHPVRGVPPVKNEGGNRGPVRGLPQPPRQQQPPKDKTTSDKSTGKPT